MKFMPVLRDYNDYISNQKCEEWNKSASLYCVSVIYKWTYKPIGTTGLVRIKVKHYSHAERIIEYWNSIQDDYHYEILRA